MTLATRLKGGERIFTAWSAIPDSLTVEAVAHLDFDAVTLDMQHGAHSEDSVARALLPVGHLKRHSIVRIPVGRFDMASRALDFGAEAIIAPMINCVEDARRLAAATKYPPLGERSWGPGLAMPRAATNDARAWLREGNKNTLTFAMIETRAALDCIDEIAAVDGIDGLFVGPADFSIAWSNGETIDPTLEDMMEGVALVANKARAAGKLAAIYVVAPQTTGRFAEMGFQLFAIGTEPRFLAVGGNNLVAAARASIKA